MESFTNGNVRLLKHERSIIAEDDLDQRWQEATGESVSEVIFLSKHTAVSKRPALTVHPIGPFFSHMWSHLSQWQGQMLDVFFLFLAQHHLIHEISHRYALDKFERILNHVSYSIRAVHWFCLVRNPTSFVMAFRVFIIVLSTSYSIMFFEQHA